MVKIQILPSLIFPESLEEVFVNTREILTVLSESLTFLASHCWLGEVLDNTRGDRNTRKSQVREALKYLRPLNCFRGSIVSISSQCDVA